MIRLRTSNDCNWVSPSLIFIKYRWHVTLSLGELSMWEKTAHGITKCIETVVGTKPSTSVAVVIELHCVCVGGSI